MKYEIRYTETYQRWYDVEADTPQEAEQKLWDAIAEGLCGGPDECINSTMEVKEV